ncbi:hypothetical protein V6N12_047556 [Hibiscus sabdariffa]|uniref:S-acyltransferase n=1 Tax=Hibiscus sabdariffa TaxID=183260 RepID=A0ABR2DB84_9ROSI
MWFVGGLSAFHLYLISTNQTTYENFRYRYDSRANPCNKGVVENFKAIFCSSIPLSKNNFRAKVPREPVLPTRPGGFMSPNMGNVVDDLELGRKTVWGDIRAGTDHCEGQLGSDRVNVKEGELGELSPDIRNTVDDTGELAESVDMALCALRKKCIVSCTRVDKEDNCRGIISSLSLVRWVVVFQCRKQEQPPYVLERMPELELSWMVLPTKKMDSGEDKVERDENIEFPPSPSFKILCTDDDAEVKLEKGKQKCDVENHKNKV